MVDKVYLLAFPRSGSSFIRLCIAYLTRLKPCQPGGGVEAPLLRLLDDIELDGLFYKYHYSPKDGPFRFLLDTSDILIHLCRDRIENMMSWTVSRLHKKKIPLTDEQLISRAKEYIDISHSVLLGNIRDNKKNEARYLLHGGKKVVIQLEEVLQDPEYLITSLRTVLPITDEAAQYFRDNFISLRDRMMAVKSDKKDGILVITSGNNTYWRDRLSAEDITKFDLLYSKTSMKTKYKTDK